MAPKMLALTLTALAAAASPAPAARLPPGTPAPAGSPDTLYCMRVEPLTGSILKGIECATREEWADRDVDVDQEWAENGVRVESCMEQRGRSLCAKF
jgi:hypothetical protein